MKHLSIFPSLSVTTLAAFFLPCSFLPAIDLDGDRMSDIWQAHYGIATGQTDDLDGDGLDNIQESIAGTDPHDPNSSHHLTLSKIDSSNLELSWWGHPNKNYHLLSSSNLQQWEPYSQKTGTGAQISTQLSTDHTKQFFTLKIMEQPDLDGDGFSPYEEWLLGTPENEEQEIHLGCTITSSSQFNSSNWAPTNLIDQSLSTNWSSINHETNENATEWLTLDFCENKNINYLELYPRTSSAGVALGFPSDFEVETSSDGIHWFMVAGYKNFSPPTQAQWVNIPLTRTVTARYVRFSARKLGTDLQGNHFFQLAEVRAGYTKNLLPSNPSRRANSLWKSYI